jgi:hypothetical protein
MAINYEHLPSEPTAGQCPECGAGLRVALDSAPWVDPAWSPEMVGQVFCPTDPAHGVEVPA